MFVSTKKAFQGQNIGGPRMRSNFDSIDRAAIYSKADVVKARETAATLAKAQGEPLTEAEALALIQKHREAEARLFAEERAEEAEAAKTKRIEFIRRRQGALAGLSQR